MFTTIRSLVASCWRAVVGSDSGGDAQNELLSELDVGHHSCGEFSLASVQANQLNEDCCQVESCSAFRGAFVGIYDGHGGPEASQYIKGQLFPRLMKCAREMGGMSAVALQTAFDATESGFESLVAEAWPTKPQLAAVGSCCLVGVISNGTLYVANLGDSRAILGSSDKTNEVVSPVQLTSEHNAGVEAVRRELQSLHPEDSSIVLLRHGIWRVKGIIQVSRSIGDVYLKRQEFNREPLYSKFRLPALPRPVLTAEPSILVHELQPQDKFLVFASDGLWEHLSNEEVVEIVSKHPHKGVAKRLVKAALKEAAKKREVRYADLKKIKRGVRRHFHDDITVIVVFLDYGLIRKGNVDGS